MNMIHVEVKQLGTAVRKVLGHIGYRSVDISMIAAETVDVGVAGGSGLRGFAYIINLDTGEYEGRMGSWGGQNMFTRGPVDDGEIVTLPPNAAVIKGTKGRGIWATIYVHPSAMGNMLPSGEQDETLTEDEQRVLYAFVHYKAFYRKEWLQRHGIGDSTIDKLVERGYLKRNKAGATQITTKGKNAQTDRY
jgi:hypothetical protein